MTNSTLTTLLGGITVQHVVAFMFVLARVSPLFLVAPAFSSQFLIRKVKVVLAVGMSFGLTMIVAHGQTMPTDSLAITAGLVENFLVGLALAYTLSCVFAAVQAAGVFGDALSGFSFGQTVDPVNGNPGGVLTNLYTVVGLAMFLAIGGDAWTIRGLTASFHAVPLGGEALTKPMIGLAEAAFASVFTGAVEIAAPLILALVISDVAFGMVSRAMPQLNVFTIAFPLKIGVALIVVGASLPFVGGWMSGQLETSLSAALSTMHI